MGFLDGPKIVTNGLVLSLDAADKNSYPGSGTTWSDLSGNNNTGSLTNSPTFNSANGGNLQFATNTYINLGNPTSLNILSYTVAAWAKSNTFTNYQNIIFKGTGTGNYGIAINSSGDWTFQPVGTFIGDTFSLNTWNYFVGTSNGTQVTAYRNGLQKRQTTISPTNDGTVVTVGADTVNSRYFNGSIALVQMYNRALSATEITQNYNAQKSRFGL
jgi:hypothetical protein